jgi:hypothetical protein
MSVEAKILLTERRNILLYLGEKGYRAKVSDFGKIHFPLKNNPLGHYPEVNLEAKLAPRFFAHRSFRRAQSTIESGRMQI